MDGNGFGQTKRDGLDGPKICPVKGSNMGQSIRLVQVHRLICNMTHLTHDLALTLGQPLKLAFEGLRPTYICVVSA